MTSWLFFLVFLVFAVLNIAFSIRVGLGLINPIAVFFTIWLTLVILYLVLTSYLRLVPLNFQTWFLILAASFGFSLGGLIALCLISTPPSKSLEFKVPAYRESRLTRLFYLGLSVDIIGIVLLLYRIWPILSSMGGLRIVLSGAGLSYRLALLDFFQYEGAENSLVELLTGAFNYLSFIGVVTVFWGAYYLLQGKRFLSLLPLILEAFRSLITMQRASFVYIFLMFVFSYYYHALLFGKSSFPNIRALKWKKILIGVAILVLILYLPIKWRYPELMEKQIFASLGQYFFAPLGGLNVFVSSSNNSPAEFGWGVWTFWGWALILSKLGLPIDLPSYHSAQFLSIGEDIVTNVRTFIHLPLLDFGTLGVLLFSSFFGFLVAYFHCRVKFRNRLVYIPLLSVLMTAVVMSFYGLSMFRDARYGILAFASLIVGQYIVVRENLFQRDIE